MQDKEAQARLKQIAKETPLLSDQAVSIAQSEGALKRKEEEVRREGGGELQEREEEEVRGWWWCGGDALKRKEEEVRWGHWGDVVRGGSGGGARERRWVCGGGV